MRKGRDKSAGTQIHENILLKTFIVVRDHHVHPGIHEIVHPWWNFQAKFPFAHHAEKLRHSFQDSDLRLKRTVALLLRLEPKLVAIP